MKRVVVAIVALAFLAGCASQVMGGFVGKPLQAGMAQYGPPDFVFDMPDGRRAFQWKMTQTGLAPTITTTQANVYAPPGAYAQVNSSQITTGGGVVSSTCLYTMYAAWQDGAWIFVGYEKPRLNCQ